MAQHDAAQCEACVRREAAIDGVAARTDRPRDTVAWVAYAITFVGAWRREGATTAHVDAAELCRMLVADLPARTPQDARDELHALGLPTSRDVGRVVYALIDAGLCAPGAGDREDDFADVYDQATIEAYAARVLAARPRDLPLLAKHVVVCALGLVGSLLVAVAQRPPTESIRSACGVGLLGAAWLLWRWSRPARMRFGLPWAMLVRRAGPHDA